MWHQFSIVYLLFTQTKLKAIQAYVAELSQQHEMLLETMDEMEKEANKKLSILEGKLTTSLQTTRVSKGTHFLLLFCDAYIPLKGLWKQV